MRNNKPRGKSYEPMNPEPTRRAPEWVALPGTRHVSKLMTDDCDFGLCAVLKTSKTESLVAWKDGRKQWREVVVQNSRIKELA